MRVLRNCLASASILFASVATATAEMPAENGQAVDDSQDVALTQLERTFWVCDYLATTEGVHGRHVVTCRNATEQLKRVKFGGSYRELLQWWRENKAAEHRKLAEQREVKGDGGK
jgi:hypothetical protein